ncbi:MAG: 30S ribosomal protein S6 [Candidatus Wildermuthbacteria bacterium]|nr:30S ribosomal protein S6 [Candidatus Wildermuthbacteria bacterium]
MKRYELNLLLNPAIEEAALLDLLGALVSFIQDQGGLLETQEIKGKKAFHGSGKNKEAMLAALTFSFSPDNIETLKKRVNGESSAIRSMIMEAPAKQSRKLKQSPAIQPPALQEPVAIAKEQEKPVDIGEIDKKLEEIFKET